MLRLSAEMLVRKNRHCGHKSKLDYRILKLLFQCWYAYCGGMSGYSQLTKLSPCSCRDTLNLKSMLVVFLVVVDLKKEYFLLGQIILAMLHHCS